MIGKVKRAAKASQLVGHLPLPVSEFAAEVPPFINHISKRMRR